MSCWELKLKDVLELVAEVCNRLNISSDRFFLPNEWWDKTTLSLYVDTSDLVAEYGEEYNEYLARLVEIIVKKRLEKARVNAGRDFIEILIPLC